MDDLSIPKGGIDFRIQPGPDEPIPDCPSCDRKRVHRERISFTWSNGPTQPNTLWEGCVACLKERLEMSPARVAMAVAEAIVADRKGWESAAKIAVQIEARLKGGK